jgi:O-antigen ligase/tetratricopeptide (TPR) repeat protein
MIQQNGTSPPARANENAASRWLRWSVEAVTLGMVAGSPWAFGCADPPFELYLHIGVGIIGLLWALQMLVEKRAQWQPSAVSFCLLAIFALGLYQLVPLPAWVLRTISPASTELIDRLVPNSPEELPYKLKVDEALSNRQRTLSVYPAATRYALFRLLAVLVLFEAVRNVSANSASFKRLSVCAFLNAIALSFVAILQFVSSSPYLMYWSLTFPVKIFGTFVCRNHFPFYVNIGLGLGLGLFFAAMESEGSFFAKGRRGAHHSRALGYSSADHAPFPKNLLIRLGEWIQALLSNPTALWISAGISIIVCADFLSMSRGGVLALIVAVLGCLIYKSFSLSRRSLSAGLIVMFALAFGLVNWLGWNLVEARYGTILTKDALSNRTPMWLDGLKAFFDAPLFGTGYGTFQYAEPVHRTVVEELIVFFDHAHNDYLEAAVEGGLLRLIVSITAIALVYVAGFRSLRGLAGFRDAEIILGGLVGFTTVVVHSFGEFGLFTPAITVLVAVLVAQILASNVWSLKAATARVPYSSEKAAPYSLRVGGLAPVGAVLLSLLVGATLVMEGWRADRQCRFRNAAERLRDAVPDQSERRIAFLQEALRWGADSAWTQQELGEVYLSVYQNKIETLDLFGGTQAFFGILTPFFAAGPTALEAAATRVAAEPLILKQLAPLYETDIEEKYLGPALRCFVQARDLCPLLARAQLRLVALGAKLNKGDSQREYLERAKLIAGYDPEFWFMGGAVALADDKTDECWPLWKQSLAISKRFFKEILSQSRRYLTPSEMLEKLLPDNPEIIVETANTLLPNPSSPADKAVRADYFNRAVVLLRRHTGEITADGWIARAWVYQEMDQNANAITALRRAITLEPKYENLRIQLARILLRNGDRAQATSEVLTILNREPWNVEANQLKAELSDIANVPPR